MRARQKRYLVGIDEAGRGPLAGPVSVAAVAVMSRSNLDNKNTSPALVQSTALVQSRAGLRDSKKLTAKKREEWWKWLKQKQKNNQLKFAVSLVGRKLLIERELCRPCGLVFAVVLNVSI